MDLLRMQESHTHYLSRRLGAIVIDGLLFTPPWLLSEELAKHEPGGLTTGEINNLLKDLSFHTLFMLYFLISEWVWGGSLGKWLVGLRVQLHLRTEPVPLSRMLLRTVLFSGTLFYVPTLVEFGTQSDLAYLLASIVAVALLLSPARPGNGYRCLHEFLSKTQVTPRSSYPS
jgi:hypothetical protein